MWAWSHSTWCWSTATSCCLVSHTSTVLASCCLACTTKSHILLLEQCDWRSPGMPLLVHHHNKLDAFRSVHCSPQSRRGPELTRAKLLTPLFFCPTSAPGCDSRWCAREHAENSQASAQVLDDKHCVAFAGAFNSLGGWLQLTFSSSSEVCMHAPRRQNPIRTRMC